MMWKLILHSTQHDEFPQCFLDKKSPGTSLSYVTSKDIKSPNVTPMRIISNFPTYKVLM